MTAALQLTFLPLCPRLSLANMLSATAGLQQLDWQDVSSSMQDLPLQAAVQDGVITFLHATDSTLDAVQDDGDNASRQHQFKASMAEGHNAVNCNVQNLSPDAAHSIDDASCLELE